jgi:hypothetical protein
VNEEGFRELQQTLSSGRLFLRPKTSVFSHAGLIYFQRGLSLRMTEDADDMERLLQWLSEIALVMEEHGLSGEDVLEENESTEPDL